MIFRCKYLIAGAVPATELYEMLKTELGYCRYSISDVAEAEVLGPYPESDGASYPVVPVTLKLETHGYDSESNILFDLFVSMGDIKQEFSGKGISVGFQEIVVDGERAHLPASYMIGELPLTVI
jgi:hypothetical protein